MLEDEIIGLLIHLITLAFSSWTKRAEEGMDELLRQREQGG